MMCGFAKEIGGPAQSWPRKPLWVSAQGACAFGLVPALPQFMEATQMAWLNAEQVNRIAEISGWDTDENFFVEKAVIHGHPDGNNKVGLHASVAVGSLVFVRLPEDASMDRRVPVTYQVSGINANEDDGAREVRMIRVRPREATTRTMLEFTFRGTALN
jgi:hypothetical protein